MSPSTQSQLAIRERERKPKERKRKRRADERGPVRLAKVHGDDNEWARGESREGEKGKRERDEAFGWVT